MKHTKEPWLMNTTKKFINNKGLAITNQESKLICEVSHDLSQLSLEEYEANAKLIAAAPEMFEILKEMTNYLQGMDSNQNVVIRIPFALSKKVGNLLAKIIDHE